MKRKITSNENKYSGQFLAKVTRLEQMDAVMQSMDNEDCYYEWIYLVPDEATREDLEYIAEDDELFREACQLYDRLYIEYREDGLYNPSSSAVNFARATDKRLHLDSIEVFY